MPAIEPRYAAGLFGAIVNKNADAVKIMGELQDFSHTLEMSDELSFFMFNPVVSANAKKTVVKQLFDGHADILTEHLLCLMIDKNRLNKLSGVVSEFNRIYSESKNILLIKVFSSEPLDQAKLDEISELYRKKYGAESAKAENVTNPALLGGIRVQIGDMLFDASLITKLRGIGAASGAAEKTTN